MAKIKDVHIFASRDIVSELDIVGEEYAERESHIEKYLALGEILQKSSTQYEHFFRNSIKELKSDISSLQKRKKILVKNYKNSINSKNVREAVEIEKEIFEISENLSKKELKNIEYSIYLDQLKKEGDTLGKKIKAVKENKNALIKNVKIKQESGKYINIIEK